uniref:LEM domain-containing protein n=1 Tax=Musca domestica TaxID=7370 RepID=A0A1I8MRU2_MUSDO
MADLEKLSNKELHKKCLECGLANIPVTDSTRKLLIRKIQNAISGNQKQAKTVKRLGAKKPAAVASNVHIAVNTKIRVRDDVPKNKESLHLTQRSAAGAKTKKSESETLNNSTKLSTKSTNAQTKSTLKGILKNTSRNNLSISQRPSQNITSNTLSERYSAYDSQAANFGICHKMQPKLVNPPQSPKVNTTVWPHNTTAKSQVLTKTPVFCTSYIQESSIYRT